MEEPDETAVAMAQEMCTGANHCKAPILYDGVLHLSIASKLLSLRAGPWASVELAPGAMHAGMG
jgi:hypothetical protein